MSSATHIFTSEQTITFSCVWIQFFSNCNFVLLCFFRMLSRISLATSSRRDRTCHLPQHLSSGVNNNFNWFNHCSNAVIQSLPSIPNLFNHCSNEGSTNPLPPLNSWLALNSHCSNEGFTNPLPPLNSWLALNSHCLNEGSTNPLPPSIPGWV